MYLLITKIFTLLLFVELLLLPSLPVQAQSELKTKSAIPERVIFQENFTPPGKKKPKDTTGAGSRDGLRCDQQDGSIQALMPKGNYGLTLQERPTIFVDMPKTSARQVVLMFRDETGSDYQRAFLPITRKGGIVSFTLPNEKQPLAVGKNYQWSLAVVCGETVQPDDPVLSGWVQRVERTSQWSSELRQKTALEQAAWYGARGYWYDMLNIIVDVRRCLATSPSGSQSPRSGNPPAALPHRCASTQPNNAKQANVWRDLLESVGLGKLANQSVL